MSEEDEAQLKSLKYSMHSVPLVFSGAVLCIGAGALAINSSSELQSSSESLPPQISSNPAPNTVVEGGINKKKNQVPVAILASSGSIVLMATLALLGSKWIPFRRRTGHWRKPLNAFDAVWFCAASLSIACFLTVSDIIQG